MGVESLGGLRVRGARLSPWSGGGIGEGAGAEPLGEGEGEGPGLSPRDSYE